MGVQVLLFQLCVFSLIDMNNVKKEKKKKKLFHGITLFLFLDVNFNILNFKNIYVINKLYEGRQHL